MSQQSTGASVAKSEGGSPLTTSQGTTSIADSVVAKIAGLAAREVAGVHEMGKSASRAIGSLKERLPGGSSGPSPTQGVSVEVGERQAAIDIQLIVEYGVSIPDVAESVRSNVVSSTERMTGLQVTEVNIAVEDVFLGESESEEPRVQ